MTSKSSIVRFSALLACALAGGSLGSAQGKQGKVVVGDKPSYPFESELLNGQEVKSLEDLRGRPVLVDFWGTHCPPCIGFAVPSAVKLSHQYGDDLAVILVECQGASSAQLASFALRHKWLGNGAMWTTERPFDLGLEGIPQSALISPEGEIVMAGYTSEIHSKLEDKIAEMVKASKDAPAGTPKSLEKAWKEFAKGKYAKALEAARDVAADPRSEDPDAARQTLDEFGRRIERQLARAAWQVENGCLVRGLERLDQLAKALEGEADLSTRVTELRGKATANQAELEAASELSKLESKLYAEGPDAKYEKALLRLAEKHTGTRAAARATELAARVVSA